MLSLTDFNDPLFLSVYIFVYCFTSYSLLLFLYLLLKGWCIHQSSGSLYLFLPNEKIILSNAICYQSCNSHLRADADDFKICVFSPDFSHEVYTFLLDLLLGCFTNISNCKYP